MMYRFSAWLALGLLAIACGETSHPELSSSQQKDSTAATPQSPQRRTGWVLTSNGWVQGSFLDYGTYAVAEEHILLRKNQYSLEKPENNLSLAAFSFNFRWPLAAGQKTIVIPVEKDPLLKPEASKYLDEALAEYNQKTHFLFRAKQPSDTNYLYVTHAPQTMAKSLLTGVTGLANPGFQPDCNGMTDPNGNPISTCGSHGANEFYMSDQPFLLQDGRYKSVILHEMAHALGMGHEFSRGDRDTYIEITNNVSAANKARLAPSSSLRSLLPFDYRSIVMYFPYLFSLAIEPNLPVIVKKGVTGRKTLELGGWELSPGDRFALSYLYAESGAPLIYGDALNSEIAASMNINSSQSIVFDIADNDVPSTTMASTNCASLLNAELVGTNSTAQQPLLSAIISNDTEAATALQTLSRTNVSGRKCKVTFTSGQAAGWASVVLKMYNDSTKTGQPSSRLIQVKVGNPLSAPEKISFSQNPLRADLPSPPQTAVGYLSSVDRDPGDRHLYSIEPGPDSDLFIIMDNYVAVAKELKKNSYTLKITSEDRAGLTFSSHIQINRGDTSNLPLSSQVSITDGKMGTWVKFAAVEGSNSIGTFQGFQWNFHDGTVGSAKSFSKLFKTPGAYQALLKATDKSGQSVTQAVDFVVPSK